MQNWYGSCVCGGAGYPSVPFDVDVRSHCLQQTELHVLRSLKMDGEQIEFERNSKGITILLSYHLISHSTNMEAQCSTSYAFVLLSRMQITRVLDFDQTCGETKETLVALGICEEVPPVV